MTNVLLMLCSYVAGFGKNGQRRLAVIVLLTGRARRGLTYRSWSRATPVKPWERSPSSGKFLSL
jgi:hypothetical protein